MQAWFGFYSVIGGLAATLLGLLFVALSVNAKAILGEGHENSKRLAEQAFQNYLAVMLVAVVAIIPTIGTASFGLATLGATAVWSVWVLMRLYLMFTRPHDPGLRVRTIRRQLSSFLGFGMLVSAAVESTFGTGDARNLYGFAVIILLFSATAVSWELLVRLADAAKTN